MPPRTVKLAPLRRTSMGLPHDRSHLLWTDAPTARFIESIDRWTKTLMDDDPSWSMTSPVMRTVAKIIAKEPGILAGQPVLNYLFTKNCRHPNLKWNISEGDEFQVGDAILTIEADGAEILSVERTAMNLITRMSGIATKTSRWVKILDEVAIAATRKTLWGVLDKWAVHVGGGLTHRLSRADALMIKENDLALYPLILTEQMSDATRTPDFCVVEVVSMEHALSVAGAWKNRLQKDGNTNLLTLLLDNLGPEGSCDVACRLETEGLRNGLVLEGSGGVRLDELDKWACSKMDVVSSGALTMDSAPIDMTMLMEAGR